MTAYFKVYRHFYAFFKSNCSHVVVLMFAFILFFLMFSFLFFFVLSFCSFFFSFCSLFFSPFFPFLCSRWAQELEQETVENRERLQKMLEMRNSETQLIERIVKQNSEDVVTKSFFADRLAELQAQNDHEREELWHELEATTDVFMPKTQLQKILNSHAAQIDAIKARLPKPVEMQHKRVWDEDLQTFVEVSEPVEATPLGMAHRMNNSEAMSTAASQGQAQHLPAAAAAAPVTSAAAAAPASPGASGQPVASLANEDSKLTRRTSTAQMAQQVLEPFQHADETQPRTRLDLELQLAATKREYQDLQDDIKELQELKATVASANKEIRRANIRHSIKSMVRKRLRQNDSTKRRSRLVFFFFFFFLGGGGGEEKKKKKKKQEEETMNFLK